MSWLSTLFARIRGSHLLPTPVLTLGPHLTRAKRICPVFFPRSMISALLEESLLLRIISTSMIGSWKGLTDPSRRPDLVMWYCTNGGDHYDNIGCVLRTSNGPHVEIGLVSWVYITLFSILSSYSLGFSLSFFLSSTPLSL